jgi:multidrug efflux pump subunit AcrA (membrane-fusion protein)
MKAIEKLLPDLTKQIHRLKTVRLQPTARSYGNSLALQQAEAQLQSSQNRIDALQLEINELELEARELMEVRNAEPTKIVSRYSGRILDVTKNAPGVVRKNEPLVKLELTEWLKVEGRTPIADARKLRVHIAYNPDAKLTVYDVNGSRFEGILRLVGNLDQSQNPGIEIAGFVKSNKRTLKPGTEVKIVVQIDPPQVIAVPAVAVVEKEGRRTVVQQNGDLYVARPVKLIRSDKDTAHVQSILSITDAKYGFKPLKSGDHIVSNNAIDLITLIEGLQPPE